MIPFHQGEIAAQARAGDVLAGAAIRDFMPDQHRDFFARLTYAFAAIQDSDGWPLATLLTGTAGFIASPDARSLRLAVRRDSEYPFFTALKEQERIGLLGIDLATRRRNRANGTAVAVTDEEIVIAVEQSFGNCPKYIQPRTLDSDPPTAIGQAEPTETLEEIDEAARRMIVESDTFFVASSSGRPTIMRGGMDISHRGGRAGFVRVEGNCLTVPDFAGNRYFNTLGNFHLHPRAGLLFLDFNTGDLLHLNGEVTLDWDSSRSFPDAERFWRLRFRRGWRKRNATPLRWRERRPASTPSAAGRLSDDFPAVR